MTVCGFAVEGVYSFLSYGAASGPCNKIDIPQVVYRFT